MYRNRTVTTLLCVVAAAGLAGCAATADNIDDGKDLAKATAGGAETIVFGKLRLVRNDQEVKLSEGVFANSARLYLYEDGDQREIVGKVGRNGDFSWALEPGNYQLSSISFNQFGKRVEPVAGFTFTVSASSKASYVGTITLETTIDSGYYGQNGTYDRFTISDDCESNCAERLTQLGLTTDDVTTSLLRWNGQLAGMN